jgi:undecaprenyl-diphosphatase
MSHWQALILGLIQGITEFFPVSSSAHLKLAKMVLGISQSEHHIFDLFCHLGTLTALVYFLRHDISRLFFEERKKLVLFLVALCPLVPCYFLLKPLRDMASATHLLGFFLMGTALILFLGSRLKWKVRSSTKAVFWIGAMQALALIPGISRSASTISTARVLGWTASEAVRFSFLLSVPTILGGTSLELIKHVDQAFSWTPCLIGFAVALGVGMMVLPFAFRILEKGKLMPFAWYCLFAGVVVTSILYV